MQVERTDFISIPTRDLANARRFYGSTLGLRESTPEGHRYPEFETGNMTLAFYEDDAFSPGAMAVSLRVPDVEEARRELESAGVAFDGDTIDTGVCHMAFCHDLDGHTLMLHRRYAPRA